MKQKETKFAEFQKLRQKLYFQFFPDDKEFDLEKFKKKKAELRAMKWQRKEEKYKQNFPKDKE